MRKRRIRLIAAAIALICITILSQYVYFRFVKKDAPVQNISIPENAERVEVVWVSDGDTYIVNRNGEAVTIRLIGVDTPESVASEEYQEKSGKHNTYKGREASEAMKEVLPKGTFIYILPGKEDTDKYGRTLVYAWFEDGKMIEDFLLENGYAKTLEIPPNTEYAGHFREVEKKA